MRRLIKLGFSLLLAIPLALVGLAIYAMSLMVATDPEMFLRNSGNLAAALEESTADVAHGYVVPEGEYWRILLTTLQRRVLFVSDADAKERFDDQLAALSYELSAVGRLRRLRPTDEQRAAETPLPEMLMLHVVGPETDVEAVMGAISTNYTDYGSGDCRLRLEHGGEPTMARGLIVYRAGENNGDWPDKAIGCATRQVLRSIGLVHDTCRIRPSVLCPDSFVRRPTFSDLLLVRARTLGPGSRGPRTRTAETRTADEAWFQRQLDRSRPHDRHRRWIWMQEWFGDREAVEVPEPR